MLANNQPMAGKNPFSWAEYDCLPLPVRRVMMFAPIELGSRRAMHNLLAGRRIREVCDIEADVARRGAIQMLAEFYSPNHPRIDELCCDR